MDKSSDSSSDSDSNSSTSWVFVEDTIAASPKAANTFHLDCSREPIQELTEQDLLSGGSDFESDTDGISVISESEIPTDESCLNIQTLVSTDDNRTTLGKADIDCIDFNATNNAEDTEEEVTTLVKEQPEKLTKIIKPLHMLGVGFVVTAVFLACYTRITTKESKESMNNVPLYEKDTVDDVIPHNKIDLMACDSPPNTDLNNDLDEIVDITMTCAFNHKPKNNAQDKRIKKCVKEGYNTKKVENSKQHYEHIISSFNGFTEYRKKISRRDMPMFKFPDAHSYDEKYSKEKYKELKRCNEINGGVCYTKMEKDIDYKKKPTDKVEKFPNKRNVVIKLKTIKKKQNSEEQVEKDKRNNYSKNPSHHKNQMDAKKSKPKYEKTENLGNDYKNKKPIYVYEGTKYNAGEDKYNSKVNYNPNKKYKNVNKENRYKDASHKYEKHKDSKFKIKEQKRNNTAGEWYTNLHKVRNQLRKQEHISDWVFDRAHLRNKKRNKAQWYFRWMNNREQLRYKQSYKPYSS